MNKEYFYVGHYYDIEGNFILKIGTSNNPRRRAEEHTRNYHKPSARHLMADNKEFILDWYILVSSWEKAAEYEDYNRNFLKQQGYKFIHQDRFCFNKRPKEIIIEIPDSKNQMTLCFQ